MSRRTEHIADEFAGLLGGGLFGLILAILLYLGAKQGSRTKCRIWLWFSTLGTCLSLCHAFVVTMPAVAGDKMAPIPTGEFFGLGLIFYFLHVVDKYSGELRVLQEECLAPRQDSDLSHGFPAEETV
ncbi:hypothetical protein Fcan01_26902 [Folsomia candida]|uniref:Uncharacterized protein n=2 Tax=Folsomia candida TaxID=158441 RepID=A0A226CZQ6_FOLCA|nr:hypothetical protein Fcan01_26902 [Folsomia candida]